MKSVGLITEYNPYHNGHQYHVQQAKLNANADITIALMSGNFVMRGEPAIYNKFLRTRMALSSVDLVVELPIIASLSSSDYFAQLAIKTADYLDINHINFGSEHGDITALLQVAQQLIKLEQSSSFKAKIREGKSYPRIVNELLEQHQLLQAPNNILGLSYLKAISQYTPHIQPDTTQRQQAHHHDYEVHHHTFASGSAIRQSLIQDNDKWQEVVPDSIRALYEAPHVTKNDIFEFLKYQIISMTNEDLKKIYTMSEGFEHRIKRYITQAKDYNEFLQLLKTKRYTYTHIQRLLMNVLLNIKQQDATFDVNAVRILGMNQTGRQYLKYIQQKYPKRRYITNVNKQSALLFSNEIKATDIYNLISHQSQNDFNTPVIYI